MRKRLILQTALASLALLAALPANATSGYQLKWFAPGLSGAAPAAATPESAAPVLPTIGDGIIKTGACASGAATGCATFNGLGLTFVGRWPSGTLLAQENLPAKTTGKWYFEVTGMSSYSYVFLGENQTACAPANGTLNYFKELISGITRTTDVYGVALDVDNTTATIYKNGVVAKVVPLGSPNVVRVAVASASCNVIAPFSFNFGQSNFVYPVPAGFSLGMW